MAYNVDMSQVHVFRLVFSVSGRLQSVGPTHWKRKKKKVNKTKQKQEIMGFSCILVYVFFLKYTVRCLKCIVEYYFVQVDHFF